MAACAIITRCLLVHMTHGHLVILWINRAEALKLLGQINEIESACSKEKENLSVNLNLNSVLEG